METIRLENEIRELFIKEGIGDCSERYLQTAKSKCASEVEYKENLILRLKQGGVLC